MAVRLHFRAAALRASTGLALFGLTLTACGAGHPPTTTTTSTRATSTTSTSTSIASACASHAATAYSSAVMADSPVAYYRLDDSSGPVMCDSSSNHSNGTYATGVQFGVPGTITGDGAVQAGSPSSGIGTGGSGSGLVGDHSFTFEAWERSTTAHNQSLVSMGQAGGGNVAGLSTWTSSTGDGQPSQLVLDLYVGVENAATLAIWNTESAGVNLWDGNWHYLAITYDASTDKVTGYVDGHDLGELTPVVSIDLAASAIRVGYWVDDLLNPNVMGDEDDVAVYPVALTPNRILAHFVASGRTVSVTTTTAGATAHATLALGKNNPAVGDCTTDTSEASSAVGYVTLSVTPTAFEADVHLQSGQPRTQYGLFMQQVPGSCPQPEFNGGTVTTNAEGAATFVASVPRVPGATTFFVQVVNGTIPSEFTSDRLSTSS